MLGAGFLRIRANSAHPDVVTYALFLAAIFFAMRTISRVPSALMWALLIPVKLIAITFLPAAFAADAIVMHGLASLATGIVNGMTVNSLGCNDPRYAELAAQFRSYYKGSETIATNSFHILDLDAYIPSIPVKAHFLATEITPDVLMSIPVADLDTGAHYDEFFWVTLPNYDPIAEPVFEMPHLDSQ
jgi:hypothetical protein